MLRAELLLFPIRSSRQSCSTPSSSVSVLSICLHDTLRGRLRYVSAFPKLMNGNGSLIERLTDHPSTSSPSCELPKLQHNVLQHQFCRDVCCSSASRLERQMTDIHSDGHGPIRYLQAHEIRRKVHDDPHPRCATNHGPASPQKPYSEI